MSLRAAIARRLEAGREGGVLARAVAQAWGSVASRRLARPLTWPEGTRVIAIGGATLGGSGKTPLAIACAAALAKAGHEVALVGHAYRASPGGARVVHPDDPVALVGDEALVAARALAAVARADSVRSPIVVVGRTRQEALDRAAEHARVVILDGVAQTAPRRASLALLALDADSPWGSRMPPPRGDLRAPEASLLVACDRAVLLRDSAGEAPAGEPLGIPLATALVDSAGAYLGADLLTWTALHRMRVGLLTSVARPSRLAAFLSRRGVAPIVHLAGEDHAALAPSLVRRAAAAPVDIWLTTAKCAAHPIPPELARRAAIIDHRLTLEPSLLRELVGAPVAGCARSAERPEIMRRILRRTERCE